MHTCINTCRSEVDGSSSPTHNLAIFLLYNIDYEPHPCTIKTHLQSSIGHYKQINHLRQPYYDFFGCHRLIQRRSPQISEKNPHQRLEKTHTIHNYPKKNILARYPTNPGLAMGSPLSCILSDIVMDEIITRIL